MIAFTADTRQLRNFGPRLTRYKRAGRRGLVTGLRDAANIIVRVAKQTRAFRDRTGNLRRGISQRRASADGLRRRVLVVGPARRYAAHVERRTPYLRPAAIATRREQRSAVRRAVRQSLRSTNVGA